MEWFKDNICKQQGMGLVEVLASLVILSLLAVTVMTVFTTSQVWIMKAGKRVQANEYASAIIENVRANSDRLSGVVLTGDPPTRTYIDTSTEHTAFSIPQLDLSVADPAKFSEQVTISQYITDNNNLYKIEVTVAWTQGGTNDHLDLSTVVGAR